MSYFMMPTIHNTIEYTNIKILVGNNDVVISKSLCYYLNLMKKQIDNYTINWDIYKKYTNSNLFLTVVIH